MEAYEKEWHNYGMEGLTISITRCIEKMQNFML